MDCVQTDVCLHLSFLCVGDCLALLRTGQRCQKGQPNWLIKEGGVL